MGLAIDSNVVHGIARGGQAFVSLGDTNEKDGSINIDGQDYLSKNNMKIRKISDNGIGFANYGEISTHTIDITSNLSNYAGYLAICAIVDNDNSNPSSSRPEATISQPFIIPTAPTTENPSFLNSRTASYYQMSLSRTTDNKFILSDNSNSSFAQCRFYILSNTAS